MDLTSFVMGRASAGGGGGTTPTQTKTATPTTSAQDVEPDSGYLLSKVTVDAIPSQYIVPAGKKTITENGTDIDVSQFATADVAVPSSGGSSWTKIYSAEVEEDYSSTTLEKFLDIDLSEVLSNDDGDAILCVKIQDKAGQRSSRFYCAIGFIWLSQFTTTNRSLSGFYCGKNGVNLQFSSYYGSSGANGIFPRALTWETKNLEIWHKYNNGYGYPMGTYTIEVYLLDYAPGGNPFS